MPKKKTPKPVQYATAPEEISLAETPAAPKKARKKKAKRSVKRTVKQAEKRAKRAAKAVRRRARKSAPAPVKKAAPKHAKPKQEKARSARRNPAPRIEAAFYQLGTLTEFEFEKDGVEKRFAFDAPPVLASDGLGKLRVVYDPRAVPGAKVPARINSLHETFNGFAPERHMAGVFGKRVPGTTVMGVLRALTYYSEKCIDPESCSSPGHYRHAFEAPFPRVLVNPAGLVLIEGGSYEITRAGIVH
ncbi:MAG: hypothetical protein AB1405_16400 [Bdellovibrionota bacterium]